MKNIILFISLFMLALPQISCNSTNDVEQLPPPPIEKPTDEGDGTTKPNGDIPPTLADSSYNYYNRAFLIKDGPWKFYREKLSSNKYAYFWNQALIILMVEDRYEFRKEESLKPLITDLLDTFREHEKNSATKEIWDWTWNEYNDDLLWAGLAFIRGYQITGEKRFLEQAEWDWNFLYTRGFSDELGGGIWWDVRKESKSSLSNHPAISMACYLYEATQKQSYLDQAKSLYDWVCTGHNGNSIFNSTTGAVDEKMNPDGSMSKSYNVYTSGAFIEAANSLHQITKEQRYYNDAIKAIDYVINNKTTNGIMSKWHLDGSWQSEFARGMGMFVKDNNLWDKYYDWMHQNAEASWKTRYQKKNITGNEWVKESPERDWTALECVSAVVMTQVVPDKKP